MNNLQIEQTPVHALQPQDRNARTHSKRQIRQIAASIRQFGFNNPILIDDDLHIIAGHGRVEAAKLVGQATVPTVRISHLRETDKRAYLIADNALATKAGWDGEILAIELQGLIDLGFDVELTGFETAEIDLIIDEWHEASGEAAAEDQASECDLSPAISRPDDFWRLGSHRLLCGDARSPDAYVRLLGTNKADLVFTDPPYDVRIDGHVSGLGRVQHREFAMASGEMTEGSRPSHRARNGFPDRRDKRPKTALCGFVDWQRPCRANFNPAKARRFEAFAPRSETLGTKWTAWWRTQSLSNPSPLAKFPANREINREFRQIRPYCTILIANTRVNSAACSEIPYAKEQGIISEGTGNFAAGAGNFRLPIRKSPPDR